MRANRLKLAKVCITFLGVLMSVFVAANYTHDTYAASGTYYPVTMYKTLYRGVRDCYNNGAVKSSFKLDKYNGVESLLNTSKASEKYVYTVTGYSDGSYKLTNYGKNSRLSCANLFKGNGSSAKSILTVNGKSAPSGTATVATIKTFLQGKNTEEDPGMGYVVTGSGEDGNGEALCYKLTYSSTKKTNAVCKKKGGGSDLLYNTTFSSNQKPHFKVTRGSKSSGIWNICFVAQGGDKTRVNYCKKYTGGSSGLDDIDGEYLLSIVTNKKACGSQTCKLGNTTYKFEANLDDVTDENGKTIRGVNYEYKSPSDFTAKFYSGSGGAAGNRALAYLSGGKYKNPNDYTLSGVETRMLYQAYLTKFYNVKVSCKSGQSDSAYDGKLWWLFLDSGEVKECHYETSKAKNKKYEANAVTSLNGGLLRKGGLTLNSLIDLLKNNKPEFSPDELAAFREEAASVPVDEEALEENGKTLEGDDAKCYEGSGKLGWILCPIIKAVADVGNNIWDWVQENLLNIPAQEFFGEGSGVQTAWGVIRDIANVLFVILFLVVIFSQLTGVGIDNYGIKKILPKLIVAAVLINLSYLLCELAVDISNILGNSLQGLFTAQAGDIDYGGDIGVRPANAIVSTALAGGAAGLYVLLNPLGIVALGIAVLGIVISIVSAVIFMFVILVIRQAGIILLVVIAPAAVACYMLPNTEKFFKKWFDLFKALLLVYPLCGALIGAGQLAASVLGSIDNPVMKVVGMVVGVLPFFLIPTLLKNSLSLLGNLGGRLQSVFGRARRGATGAVSGRIRNSEMAKDVAERKAYRRNTFVAGVFSNPSTRLGRRISARANRGVAGYQKRQEDMYSDILARETDRGAVEATLNNALVGDDAEQASAAMKEMIARGGVTEVLSAMDGADWNSMNSGVRDRLIQTMATSNVDALQSYAKYRGSGGSAGFRNWYNGTRSASEVAADTAKGTKDSTYAHHLQERGIHAMDGLSKDEIQFMTDNARSGDFVASMGAAGANYGATMASAAINSGDARVKTVAEASLREGLANGSMNLSDMNLTSDSLANMRSETADAIMGAYEQRYRAKTPGMSDDWYAKQARMEIQLQLEKQIETAKSDPRVLSNMKSATKKMLAL